MTETQLEQETIVAIATAPGRGGIGVVRLSGTSARAIAEPLLRLRNPMEAGRAQFGLLLDPAKVADGGEVPALDEVVVTFFAGPRSYTGEDVVELAAHGSPILLETIVRGCLAGGARLAEPGEFTQRAFLTGRLDLTQAEAVNDLIQSTTLHQVRTAARQMGGAVAREIAPTKKQLVELIATLEAGIDFAEDDIDVLAPSDIVQRIGSVALPLHRLEASYSYGRLVREGFRLAIVGRPNAGKSSLFNALIERDHAIVTAAPGTTRDLVTGSIDIDGIPVELIDTAGLRQQEAGGPALDEAELLGIQKSRQAMADADVVLLVIDGAAGLQAEDQAVLASEQEEQHAASDRGRLIVVISKSDLFERATPITDAIACSSRPGITIAETSTKTGAGIQALRSAILAMIRGGAGSAEGGLLTNLRQHQAVIHALEGLEAAMSGSNDGVPHEVILLDLHRALRALDELTGTTTSDDILHLIFSSFCIGK